MNDFVPAAGQHSTDFAVFAFPQLNLQKRTASFAFQKPDGSEAEVSIGEMHASAEFRQRFVRRDPGHLSSIASDDFVTRMGQLLRQITVIRQQQQSLRILIQPPDREQSLRIARHQIDGAWPSRRIPVRAQDTFGLVEQIVLQPRQPQPFTVQQNRIRFRLDHVSRVGNRFPVHHHPAIADIGFTVAT